MLHTVGIHYPARTSRNYPSLFLSSVGRKAAQRHRAGMREAQQTQVQHYQGGRALRLQAYDTRWKALLHSTAGHHQARAAQWSL